MTFRALTLSLLLLAAVTSACSELRSDESERDEEATPTSVASIAPVRADGVVRAEGKIVPVEHVALAFPGGGEVAKVLVSEGERVAAGDPLIRLDGAVPSLAVLRAEAELRAAEAEATRVESLLEIEQAASSGEGEAAFAPEATRGEIVGAEPGTSALATADAATVAAALARVDVARAALEQAMTGLDATELVAPFDGIVASIDVAPSEYASPGVPVLVLADDSEWRIETENLTERDIDGIEAGDRVAIRLDAIPGLELDGKVVRVRPVGENRLGDVVFTVVVRPDESDRRLRWNMTADVEIRAEERRAEEE